MLKNIIANFFGRFWSILSNYLFIPLYISFLGIESYSVISFSLILVGIMGILDAGMTATLSREFANSTKDVVTKQRTLSTFEIIYFCISIVIVLLFFVGAEIIATEFIEVSSISHSDVVTVIKILGIGIALQMIANFYMGGLLGLGHQVSANILQIVWGIFKNGLVIVLIWYLPSITYFFWWQIVVTLFYVIALRYFLLKKLLENDTKMRFKWEWDSAILKNTWRFAGGMLLISLVAVINTQLDKLAISKLLPLAELGYYTLAVALAQGLVVITSPIAMATLPKFTSLYSESKISEASDIFYHTFNMVAVIVFSFASILVLFSFKILYIWTGNMELSIKSENYTPIFAVGSAFLSMQVIPYNIAIANAYTRFNNIIGLASILFTIPAYWISVKYYGAQGAAISWMVFQVAITPIYIYLIDKKFLVGHTTVNLLWRSVLLPILVSITISGTLYYFIPMTGHRLYDLLLIGTLTMITLVGCGAIALSTKNKVFFLNILRKIKNLRFSKSY